jgi:hypothetical protein
MRTRKNLIHDDIVTHYAVTDCPRNLRWWQKKYPFYAKEFERLALAVIRDEIKERGRDC